MSAVRSRSAGALALLAWSTVVVGAGGAAAAAPAPAVRPDTTGTLAGPRVEVALDPPRATVGDRVEAVLRVAVPPGAGAPRFPSWRQGWGAAEVLAVDEPVLEMPTDGGRTVYRQRLVLAAFAPGRVELPPVAVAVPLAEQTLQVLTPPALALEIASVLPPVAKGEKLAPKPAADLRPLPWGERFWWTAGTLSTALLGAALLLRRRFRLPGALPAPAAPALAPLAELLARLDHLDAVGPAAPLPAHTQLSLALRRYLGRSLGFPAAESTTSEIQRLLARRVPAGQARRAVDLLRACDLVKFARQEAGPERVRERIAAARQVAAELESQLHPPAPPAPSGARAGAPSGGPAR